MPIIIHGIKNCDTMKKARDHGLLSIPHGFPQPRATRIVNDVKGVNRVVYDVRARPRE